MPSGSRQPQEDARGFLARHLSDYEERAVIGGVSLGADVSLQLAVMAPERMHGLIVEMPVMENATPFAALLFVPQLLAVQFGGPVARLANKLWGRVPRTRLDALNSVLNTLSAPPEVTAAVLHGILVGPVAPDIEHRRGISVPTLVIGHKRDMLHPFTDEYKQDLEFHRRHSEEIHRREFFHMQLEKRLPCSRRRAIASRPVPLHGGFGNIDAEFLKFSNDAGRPPSRICSPHALYQLVQFGRYFFGRPGRLAALSVAQIIAKAPLLPVHDGSRLHDIQRRSPARPETGHDSPQEPISRPNAGARITLFVNGKPISQKNDFRL